jgi:hypothetical protein
MNAPRASPPSANRRPRPPAAYARLFGATLAALAAAMWVEPLQADGLEGRFEVRSADLQLTEGVYHLNAHLDLPVSDAVRRGLADGVPLAVELDLDIERVRQLLPNSRVAELTQRYHLQYNAVSARYVLRNDNSGQQQSLSTVDDAIEQLSEVRALPVLDKALLSVGRRYEANVRAKVDYGSVPFSLRVVMFWVNDWHRESDWYTWTLQP